MIKNTSLFYKIPNDVLLYILKYLNNREIMMFEWSVNMTQFRNISYKELFKSELESKIIEKYDNKSYVIIDQYYINQSRFFRNKLPRNWKYNDYYHEYSDNSKYKNYLT
jgi:hypothetical protein